MARPSEPAEDDGVFRIAGRENPAVGEPYLVGADGELGSGAPGELIAQSHRREMRGTGDGTGKPARIIAGGDRPGVLAGIELGIDPDCRRRQAEDLADHLGHGGSVSLPLRHRVDHGTDPTQRIEPHGSSGQSTAFRSGACAFLGHQSGRDVAHVRDRRLDDCSVADAVEPALGARLLTAHEELGETALFDRRIDGAEVVARVEDCPGWATIGKGTGPDEIAADHVERVEADGHGNPVHQPLERKIDLRPAKTAVETARRLVGQDEVLRIARSRTR